MAKKANRSVYVPDAAPGADPNGGNVLLSRKMGTILGCACLLMFIIFDELWIGTLAFGIGFLIIFGIQVVYEKSKAWYASANLYASIACFVLAYVEFYYGFLTELMRLG